LGCGSLLGCHTKRFAVGPLGVRESLHSFAFVTRFRLSCLDTSKNYASLLGVSARRALEK
jgi:hypothetical protein